MLENAPCPLGWRGLGQRGARAGLRLFVRASEAFRDVRTCTRARPPKRRERALRTDAHGCFMA